jgi:PiT family inorganic phosphate transporter
VRWRVALRLLVAWLITLPAAALVGAAMWWLGHLVGGVTGGVAIVVVLLALAGCMFIRARREPVHADNVNDEWSVGEQPALATVNV